MATDDLREVEDAREYAQVANDLISIVREHYGDGPASVATVLVEALSIHIERDKKYGTLWHVYGWKGNLFHILHKAARLKQLFWGSKPLHSGQPDTDDLLDIINYSAFTVVDMRANNEYG